MPGPAAVAAVAVQRIGVEIMLAVARQAGERTVEQRLLHHVGIFAVEVEMQHALRPEDQRDRGAGLGIGGIVGQVVVLGEALVGRGRTEPRGNVDLGGHDVGPQHLAGALEAVVLQFGREIGHRRIHVHGAHRVADHLALFAHRLVRLVVLVALRPEILGILAAMRSPPGRNSAAARPRSSMK